MMDTMYGVSYRSGADSFDFDYDSMKDAERNVLAEVEAAKTTHGKGGFRVISGRDREGHPYTEIRAKDSFRARWTMLGNVQYAA